MGVFAAQKATTNEGRVARGAKRMSAIPSPSFICERCAAGAASTQAAMNCNIPHTQARGRRDFALVVQIKSHPASPAPHMMKCSMQLPHACTRNCVYPSSNNMQ